EPDQGAGRMARALVGVIRNERFFFSSRRRHTRFSRDWSSDVCSSDLLIDFVGASMPNIGAGPGDVVHHSSRIASVFGAKVIADRSEERRVGKEWRSELELYG